MSWTNTTTETFSGFHFPALIKVLFRCVLFDSRARPCKVFRVAAKHGVKEVKTQLLATTRVTTLLPGTDTLTCRWAKISPRFPSGKAPCHHQKLACWRAP